jgi:hypothetical protein
MSVFLEGVAAQFYRGIGAETQFIAPFGRMNFFIGANNAGKSIVLRLIADHVAVAMNGAQPTLDDGAEVYRHGEITGPFLIALGGEKERILKEVCAQLMDGQSFHERQHAEELAALTDPVLSAAMKSGALWSTPAGKNAHGGYQDHISYPPLQNKETEDLSNIWFEVQTRLRGQRPRYEAANWIAPILERARKYIVRPLPTIHLIPAKRVLGEKGEAYTDQSGRGLMDELAKLQTPSVTKQSEAKKFANINRFLQEVTGKTEAKLSVPFEGTELLVHMENKVLPLSALGTGIHEVILIAAFSTIHDGSIMCIEEPEIHLHPVLQRKLIAYLEANTSSQYFIATHSAAFMDTPDARIFHVTNDGVQTYVGAAATKKSQRNVLDDLGYQASDILQANAVIWVEGPSDRIYLNHWIKHVDDRLIEGIHYSIMFYGGGLISHLTTADDAVADFIALRQLNRNMAILMDSDRSEDSAPLKPHAQRIVEELASGGGIAWITAGREVENYVDGDRLQKALKALHPRVYKDAGPTGRFDHAFHFFRENPSRPGHRERFKDGDKVGAARLLCETPADLSRLDLRERLAELCIMICKANGIDPKGID